MVMGVFLLTDARRSRTSLGKSAGVMGTMDSIFPDLRCGCGVMALVAVPGVFKELLDVFGVPATLRSESALRMSPFCPAGVLPAGGFGAGVDLCDCTVTNVARPAGGAFDVES